MSSIAMEIMVVSNVLCIYEKIDGAVLSKDLQKDLAPPEETELKPF